MENYWEVKISCPKKIRREGGELSRELWIDEMSSRAADNGGFLGIFEGQTTDKQFDAGIAPREDPISKLESSTVHFYFEKKEQAENFKKEAESFQDLKAELEEVISQDWNQKWTEGFRGLWVEPCWNIVPSHLKETSHCPSEHRGEQHSILINPGMGFGSGTHPTTQLCLRALGSLDLKGKSLLDFGAGSGILSVAAAKRLASVDAVEIDPMAVENAKEIFELNKLNEQIFISTYLPAEKKYDVIVANILLPVLLEFSSELASRISDQGILILSGIMENDIEELSSCYRKYFSRVSRTLTWASEEWRALIFFQN